MRDLSKVVPLVVSLSVAACSSEAEPPPTTVDCDGELCLAAPLNGFQMESVGDVIEPGQDIEYCEVVQIPGNADQEYWVNRFEVAMTKFSHHLIVAAVIPGSETDLNAQVGDKIPCSGVSAFGEDLMPGTGSQQPYNEEVFPEGVGRQYFGGQKLIFDYHYYNTSSEPVQARGKVNFHTTTKESVERISWPFGMLNLGFNVAPGSKLKTTAECRFNSNAYVWKLTRHTHRWGQDFDVWYAGGERDGEHLFNSPHYEDIDHVFEEPLFVPKGEGFRFSCEFTNTETYPLKFGVKATDEMCILFGDWYVENVGEGWADQGCWVFEPENEPM